MSDGERDDEQQEEEERPARAAGQEYYVAANLDKDMSQMDHSSADEILDMLKLVDYEQSFLPRASGLKPLNKANLVYQSNNPSEQFWYFANLVGWLAEELGARGMEKPKLKDNPSATVTNIMEKLRELQLPTQGYTPVQLKQGFGDQCIHVVMTLLDRLLEKKGFRFQRPVYPAEQQEIIEEDTDDGGEVEDNARMESDEEEEFYVKDQDKDTMEIKSQVSADAWRMELARVEPLLKITRRQDSKDWRAHIENITQWITDIEKVFPETKETLQKIAEDIEGVTDQIKKREDTLGGQFESWVADYRNLKTQHDSLEGEWRSSNDARTALSERLNSTTEEAYELKQGIDERSKIVSDPAPLTKIKDTLSSIKSEIKQMELRIGALQHQVLNNYVRPAQGNSDVKDDDDNDDGEFAVPGIA